MSNNTNSPITKAQLRGLRIGTFFGMVWFVSGVTAIHTKLLQPVLVVGIILIITIVKRIIALQHIAHPTSETALSLNNNQFRLIVLTEALGIAVAVLISKTVHKTELITPLIMLTVGLHFFWMAQLFKLSRYNLLALEMSLIAIVLVAVDATGMPKAQTLRAVAGLTSAGLLWISVLSVALTKKHSPTTNHSVID